METESHSPEGKSIGERLAELNADPWLVLAAERGLITELACSMPECLCPQGPTFFERRGDPRHNRWAPSADRWPVPGREGGEYVLGNVRLAHFSCNSSEGGRFGGKAASAKLSPEELSLRGRIGGRASVASTTREQRAEWGRDGGRLRWADLSPEERSRQNQARWEAKTPEQREDWKNAMRATLTPEEYDARVREGLRASWGRLTPEERAARGEGITRGLLANSTADERSARAKARYANLTPDKRTAFGGGIGLHTRWHVNRGRVEPACSFCVGLTPDEPQETDGS
jgi:hypothetical protein